ncbi:hypothetical protein SKUN_001042 [Spiroplasma kunkelii CR2-3x]|uniref:Uncharacterized protein n=1 Tax=Spiroplasma kunkelii CR2-3x TaxID=273035 RepID=A0A0K2JHM5_SPIKU|nr:hypothetical protein [Spiroplasma kunkelii]ALA97928.1 hypothetical protein SKUN_001042 [Spiroplasma kunkelii CR2-3x]
MTKTESIKFDKLQEENEALEQEILSLKHWIQNGGCHEHIQKDIDKLQEENEALKKELA